MEQMDLDLLQTAPPYHVQALVKSRRMPLAAREQSATSTSASSVSSVPTIPTIVEIAEYLFDPATIHAVLQGLNDTEMALLRELVACGGRANSRDLALYLTSSGVVSPVKGADLLAVTEYSSSLYPPTHPHGIFEQSLHHLLLLGLLFWGKQTNFAGRDYTNGVYDGILIVPQAVRGAVKAIIVPKVEGAHETVAQPFVQLAQEQLMQEEYPEIGEGVRAFQRMLYRYWSLVAPLREGLGLVTSGLLAKAALRQVVDALEPRSPSDLVRTEQEVPRLLFIRLLMMKLGLLQERNGALYAVPAYDYFALPLQERARRCYRLWLESDFWNELGYLLDVVLRPGPGPLEPAHEEVVRGRQALVERVFHERVDRWCELFTFIARTKLYTPYILFPRQSGQRTERYLSSSNPYGWDFRLRRGWLTPREGWYMVEGGFIRSVVSGPLHWLGLVEMEGEGNATKFRPTPTLSLVSSDEIFPPEETVWGRLIVQPNFELVALAPVSENLLIKLDRFAERISLEHIAQYRITKASVTRAVQMGLHAENIQQALQEAAGEGGELPQNVQYSLIEWERQARRIEVWKGATLLEVDDPLMLDQLLAGESTRLLFGRRLSPVLVEVAPQHRGAVQEYFWQRDFLPALAPAPAHDNILESGHFVAREPQWQLRNDGLLQPLYAVLDLYLVAEVARITDLDEETGWRKITPLSLQRSTGQGISLEAIIRFLQQYCEGGVPTPFLMRLKLWGGGYGTQPTIQVEPSPMLYLSAPILRDLQTDEELRLLLGLEVPAQGSLVRVPSEHLERVVELLRERGFEVENE